MNLLPITIRGAPVRPMSGWLNGDVLQATPRPNPKTDIHIRRDDWLEPSAPDCAYLDRPQRREMEQLWNRLPKLLMA